MARLLLRVSERPALGGSHKIGKEIEVIEWHPVIGTIQDDLPGTPPEREVRSKQITPGSEGAAHLALARKPANLACKDDGTTCLHQARTITRRTPHQNETTTEGVAEAITRVALDHDTTRLKTPRRSVGTRAAANNCERRGIQLGSQLRASVSIDLNRCSPGTAEGRR
jgi:hypothetical protein